MTTAEAKGPHDAAQVDFRIPDEIRDPRIRECFAYWRSKCRCDLLPSRAALDPLEMKSFLSAVLLLDVERDRGRYRFRYRLMGTHTVEIFGRDATGLYMDDTNPPDRYPAAYALHRKVVDTRRPACGILPVF